MNCKSKPNSKTTKQALQFVQHYAFSTEQYYYDFMMNRVYPAFNTNTNQKVLIKAILMRRLFNRQGHQTVSQINELAALKNLGKFNIVTFIQCLRKAKTLYLVFPNHQITLDQYLKGRLLSDDEIFLIWLEIFYTVYSVNQRGFLHRSILPRNIILDKKGKWRLTGFESSTKQDKILFIDQKNAQHNSYMPPETLRDNIYNEKSQIWSLGLILYQLATNRHPYETAKRKEDLLTAIYTKKFRDKLTTHHPIFSKLISMCLRVNSQNRSSFSQIENSLENDGEDEELPLNFKKILHLNKQLMEKNKKITRLKDMEKEDGKQVIQLIQKQFYFIQYLHRMAKLMESLRNILKHFSEKQKAIDFYIYSRIEGLQRLIGNLNSTNPLYINKLALFTDEIQLLKPKHRQYRNVSLVSENNCCRHINENLPMNEIFLIHFQALLKNSIIQGILFLQATEQQNLPLLQRQIYAIDFLTSLYLTQKQVIDVAFYCRQPWNFITTHEIKKMAESPFNESIDIIYQELQSKWRKVGILDMIR